MKILTARQMAEADRRTIEERDVPASLLMEEAGRECLEGLLDTLEVDPEELSVLVVCGKGNNGGDGLVLARLLQRRGAHVEVALLWPGAELSADAARNLGALRGLDGLVHEASDETSFRRIVGEPEDWDVVVDAVFGTGLTPPVEGWRGGVLEWIATCPAFVLAVDLPSGLAADDSRVTGPAVAADLTVTLAALKPCLVLLPAALQAGEIMVGEIGIPEEALVHDGPSFRLAREEEVVDWLEALRRPLGAHKGDHGRILVVAGSMGKSGAAVLASLAALRGGAGLVTLAVPASTWAGVAPRIPEVMVEPIPEGPPGALGAASFERLAELLEPTDVLALGPGLGRAEETAALVFRLLSAFPGPRVVDADGLWALGRADEPIRGTGDAPLYLTPHPGEMGRLLGCEAAAVEEDRLGAVRRAAERYEAHVLLKGARSLAATPSGDVRLNPTGGPVLASGGTGDVLTGLVAALIGQGVHQEAVLPAAAWLHGLAGDLLAETCGETGVLAGDVAAALPVVCDLLRHPPGDGEGPFEDFDD